MSESATLSVDSANRAQVIVDGLLAAASREGELAVSWARLMGGLIVTLLWPVFHFENMVSLVPRVVAAEVLGILAVCWSLFVFYRLRQSNPSRGLIYTSIAIDAVLMNALVLMYLIAPGDTHDSIVEVHGMAFVYLAVVTAGVRLSPRAAYFGAALNSVLLGIMIVISTIQVDNLKIMGGAEWITVVIGLIGSTVLGVTIATRTSRLVQQSARETMSFESARVKLGAYVSPEVATMVLKQPELRLGGERQNVAVLFSDLRGFTGYSESLEPEQIVDQLNEYLSVMVDTITRHEGIVDKFMGDGIMAVFGAPLARVDDADRAIACAKAMMQAIDHHNQARQSKGLPRLKHGIGVHYGPVVAGNVGTAARAAYTVIGDTVNLASRLEGLSKQIDADIVVSEHTTNACTQPHGLARIDMVQVVGRAAAVTIYGM